jgi:hypothetical protein
MDNDFSAFKMEDTNKTAIMVLRPSQVFEIDKYITIEIHCTFTPSCKLNVMKKKR